MNLGFRLCMVLFSLLAASRVCAGTSCWISSAPAEFSAIYSSTANVRVNTTVTVRCQTTSGTQAVSYSLTPDNGLNPSGTQNRAQSGSGFLNYDLYSNNTCTTLWTSLSGTMTANTTGVNRSATVRQCTKPTTPAPNAGYHTDIQTLTLSISTPGVIITGTNPWTFPVNVGVPLSCQVSSPPGNIDFGTYPAFSTTSRSTSTTFNVRCTQANLSLTIDIGDNQNGVVPNTGLIYSLSINTTNTGGSNPFDTNASGTANSTKTFYINGSMAAGQAGSCSTGTCAGSDVRTLTITY